MTLVHSAEPPSAAVDALARAIRARYIANRRHHEFVETGRVSRWGSDPRVMARYDGGRTSNGTYHQNIWLNIARYFIANGVDMCQALDSAFANAAGGDPPQPNFFLSRDAIDLSGYMEQAVQNVKTDFETAGRQARIAYSRYIETRPDERTVWRSVITDPSIIASPLFRYLLSVHTNNHDLADHYKAAAQAQFLARSYAYVKALPDLPKDFVAAAAGVDA